MMRSETAQRIRYLAGDFLATNLAWLIFNIIRYIDIEVLHQAQYDSLGHFLSTPTVILGQILFPVLMLGIFYLSGFYNNPFFKSRIEELLTTMGSTAAGCLVIFFIAIINDPIPDRKSNYILILWLWGLQFGIVWLTRLCITQYGIANIRRGKWRFHTLLIGEAEATSELFGRLRRRSHRDGFDLVGIVTTDASEAGHESIPLPVYPLEKINEVCAHLKIKNLIVATRNTDQTATLSLLNRLFSLELPIFISPTLFHLITGKQRLRNISGEPLLDISSPAMSQSTANLKRCGDAVVSALALITLSPLLAAIAIAVKFSSKGPVFYRQERIGYHKKPFRILKFRTMRADAEANGPQLSTAEDPRITPVGRILRKYRLDELPQFWNVLLGEMSIVGPRPEREYFIRQIMARAPYYALIHQVRPGITSWGMVRHGYASDVGQMIDRLQYDLLYIANVSLLVDLKILVYTVNTVFTGKGL